MRYKNRELIQIILVSLLVTLVFCTPFLSGTINVGSDTCFHMNRIVALKTAILNGDYYPYVLLNQNYQFGYGSPMFYCILYLYPAALLNMFFSIAVTWKIYIFLIIFFACISIQSSLYSFIDKPSFVAKVTAASLYVLNYLVLTRVYKRGAIGEILALIFMPLVIVYIKKILFDKKDCWAGLGISFSLLLFAHNVSFILFVLIFGLLIVIKYKTIIKDRIYISIIKGTIFALLLCLFFLLPMFEQLNLGIYNINSYYKIRMEGISIYDLISPSISGFGGYHESSLLISLFILPLLLLKSKNYRWLVITGYTLLFLSTNIVPWNYIPGISFIQFTTRLINVALPFLSISAGIVMNYYKELKISYYRIIIIGSLLISLTTVVHGITVLKTQLYGSIYNNTSEWDITDCDTMTGSHDYYNTLECSTPEYLPDKSFNYYDFKSQMYSYGLYDVYSITGNDYNAMQYFIYIYEGDYRIIYPKTYYKGYVIDIYDKNNVLVTTIDADIEQNAFVCVDLPANLMGETVKTVIRYEGTMIQKISAVLSIGTLILYVVYSIIKTY